MRTFNQFAKEGIRPDSSKIIGAETLAERYRSPSPLLAQSNTQKLFFAGTHRDREPRCTVAHVAKFYERIGITRVANITGLDVLEIPVVSVIRPNARSISVSQGKGVDLAAAKASGVMEAIEIFHGENDLLHRCHASARELKAFEEYAVAINFPKKKNSKYRSDLEIQWTLAWDLMNHQPVWVPYETVHCRYTLPKAADSGCFSATTNGLASGNNWSEAVLHGMCEIIERDAYTLWAEANIFPWCRGRTRVDPGTVSDSGCKELLRKIENAGFKIAIWNLTSDIGVPTFRCDIAPPKRFEISPLIGTGTGCHPDRGIALSRALTEAAQHRLTIISGARDNLPADAYLVDSSPALKRRLEIIMNEPVGCDFESIDTYIHGTIEADLRWLLRRMSNAGLQQAFVVDLTLPEFNIPVIRALVPGLEDGIDISNYALGERAQAAARQIL